MNSKWKNYGLWLAIFAYIPLIVEALAGYDITVVLPGNYEAMYKGLLGIFVLMGIISNPSIGNGYTDRIK